MGNCISQITEGDGRELIWWGGTDVRWLSMGAGEAGGHDIYYNSDDLIYKKNKNFSQSFIKSGDMLEAGLFKRAFKLKRKL